MSAAQKETIYIDIDDEITAIIDKVESAKYKIVALVLPKRAAVLQSMVNMKLLKRSADEASKHLVLITSETSLMPLAGAVGLHVAKTLQSKPAVPSAPADVDNALDIDETEADDADIDASQPIGALAGLAANEPETIELDNTDKPSAAKAAAGTAASAKATARTAKNKKLKIPNFNKFRTRLFLAGGTLILLGVLWYVAAFVMPRANIVLKTDTTITDKEISFSTDPELAAVDLEGRVLPSKVVEVTKTDTEKVPASGQEDRGTKSSGQVTMTNCTDSTVRLNSGTGVSANGLTFIIQSNVILDEGEFNSGGVCKTSGDHVDTVNVVAAENGDKYNVGSQSYSVAGAPSGLKAQGSAMSGGTSRIVKIVSQSDIDKARKTIEERTNSEVEAELTSRLEQEGYYAMKESLMISEPKFTPAPAVGQEAGEVTVSSEIKYSLAGIKKDDLEVLIKDSVKDEIAQGKQSVQSTGLGDAVIRLTEKQPTGVTAGAIQTLVTIGPDFNMDQVKQDVAGKKRSETEQYLRQQPGVTDVQVDYSPFWVFSTPSQTSKINITLEQPQSATE